MSDWVFAWEFAAGGKLCEIITQAASASVPCAAEHPAEKCICPDLRTCPPRLLMTQLRADLAVRGSERDSAALRRGEEIAEAAVLLWLNHPVETPCHGPRQRAAPAQL